MLLELLICAMSILNWLYTDYYSVIDQRNTRTEISFDYGFLISSGSIFRIQERTQSYFPLLNMVLSILVVGSTSFDKAKGIYIITPLVLSIALYAVSILHIRCRYIGNVAELENDSYIFRNGDLEGLRLNLNRKYFFFFDLEIANQPTQKVFRLESGFSISTFRLLKLIALLILVIYNGAILYMTVRNLEILTFLYEVGIKNSLIYLVTTYFVYLSKIGHACWLTSHYFNIEEKGSDKKHYISFKCKWYSFLNPVHEKLPFFGLFSLPLIGSSYYEASKCLEQKSQTFLPSKCIILSSLGGLMGLILIHLLSSKVVLSVPIILLWLIFLTCFTYSVISIISAYKYRKENKFANIVGNELVFTQGELSGLRLNIKHSFLFFYDLTIEDESSKFSITQCHPMSIFIIRCVLIFLSCTACFIILLFNNITVLFFLRSYLLKMV